MQFATTTEATAGTDSSKAVTPAGIKAVVDKYREGNGRSASFTLTLADDDKVIPMTGTVAQTVTIPTNATVALPLWTQIHFIQRGTGTVTFAASAGVTIETKDSTKKTINGQHAWATLIKVATDTWSLGGDLKA